MIFPYAAVVRSAVLVTDRDPRVVSLSNSTTYVFKGANGWDLCEEDKGWLHPEAWGWSSLEELLNYDSEQRNDLP